MQKRQIKVSALAMECLHVLENTDMTNILYGEINIPNSLLLSDTIEITIRNSTIWNSQENSASISAIVITTEKSAVVIKPK